MIARRAVTFVELEMPRCANVYGNSPCQASVPTTGVRKCFNSRCTCQDINHFIFSAPTELRFCEPQFYMPESGIFAIPSVLSVTFTPAIISLGKDMGTRASFEVVFRDHPDDDSTPGIDPYLAERDYVPFRLGTFWGKFRSRNPYILGSKIRLITGYLGQDIEDMETRHFIVESYDGPSEGKFKIRGTDPLKLADDAKSVAPAISEGYLVANITTGDTTMTVTPSGIGSTYRHSGWANVGGSELVAFQHDPTAGNDANTVLLVHCDGADASTAFTDSSTSAKALTANGNVQVDTAQFVFNGASALFDGTGDFISALDSADWTFAGNFTLECRARFASLAANRTLLCHSTDINNMYRLYVTTAGALKFDVVSASSTIITLTSADGLIVVNNFYHLAVARTGNVFLLFIDGVVVGTVTDSDAIPNFTSTFKIGISGNGSSDAMNGWIDEVRVSKVARWADDFDERYATGRYATTTDAFFITRAQLNTIAAAHTAQDRVQQVLSFVSKDPADILYELYTEYVPGFDPDWINLANWQAETSSYNGNTYTTYITEPTSVKTLTEEMIEQGAMALWWDEVNQLVQMQVMRAVSTTAFDFTPANYRRGTSVTREQLDKRVSQVMIYFGQINPLLTLTNKDNFRSNSYVQDTVSEANWGQPAIKIVLSRWIPQAGRTVADRLAEIMLGRYKNPPRSVSFEVQRYSSTDPVLGGGYHFFSEYVQDFTGALDFIPFQVTQIKPTSSALGVSGEEMLFDVPPADLTSRNVTFDANRYNLNLRTEHDSIYPAPTGVETVTFTINTGVTIGSTLTANPGINVGTWPAGTVVNLVVNGRIQGKGGAGGSGSNTSGSAGGTALYLRRAINLSVASGEIWGGGGGGGAQDAGGGGGAGTDGGAGGVTGTKIGSPGTATAGGAGSQSAGAGGGPGLAGAAGAGAGGAAGVAIDGVSFRTLTTGPGDIRGGQVN